eukprot:CAMPEP_0178970528 /NCGR_PEP_ID=MMETSP0789-20121207/19615_1 /TAXON_ID=3005 /ORGANISM="Rhizosolenia setigera, Strain CCMP 1694" /LENGTH=332 /DNA_ID=CAMNT_0020657089 /DNA_START=124 /DNA_END=1122 /DNA_ORIENTATION=-
MQLLLFTPLLSLILSCTEGRFLPQANSRLVVVRKGIEATRNNEGWEPGANPNEGYPDQPAWSFDKAPPKASLQSVGPQKKDRSGTAAAWILNIVEGAHWLTLPPTFLGSYAIMLNHDFWLNMFGGSELRVLLFCLAPLIGFVGGLPPIVMHTYESWQVAPFRNPVEGEFVLQDYNNGWMRAVAYKYLFIIQGVGLVMANHGYNGFKTVGISLALILLSYVGDQSKKATFKINDQPVFPVPIVAIPLFLWGVIFNLLAAISLAGHISDNPLVHWGLIVAPLLTAAGGVVEGLIAESTFNQWIHLGAVIMLIAGASLQAYSFFQVPGSFSVVSS